MQAVQRERVDLEVVQREVGVDVEADVRREGAGELLRQAGGRLAAHWRTRITFRNTQQQLVNTIKCINTRKIKLTNV